MTIVEVAHTVVNPGTVMVHPENAFFANAAMMRAGRLESFTVFAVSRQRLLFLDLSC